MEVTVVQVSNKLYKTSTISPEMLLLKKYIDFVHSKNKNENKIVYCTKGLLKKLVNRARTLLLQKILLPY